MLELFLIVNVTYGQFLSLENSFGGEVAEYLTDEEFEKRFEVFEGILFYHDRRDFE